MAINQAWINFLNQEINKAELKDLSDEGSNNAIEYWEKTYSDKIQSLSHDEKISAFFDCLTRFLFVEIIIYRLELSRMQEHLLISLYGELAILIDELNYSLKLDNKNYIHHFLDDLKEIIKSIYELICKGEYIHSEAIRIKSFILTKDLWKNKVFDFENFNSVIVDSCLCCYYTLRNEYYHAIEFYRYAIADSAEVKTLLYIDKTKNIDRVTKEKIYKEFNEMQSRKYGKLGGQKKGGNLEPIKQKILAYHDERFTERKENGKFLHGHSETARLIIKHLKIDCYTESSLSNIIAQHRKTHFTP